MTDDRPPVSGEPHDTYMCPNCVTPWKCNGPHLPRADSPSPEGAERAFLLDCAGHLAKHGCNAYHAEGPCRWQRARDPQPSPEGAEPPSGDTARAIAIIEDSRQTHVNWLDWRQKGHGTDEDHEMIGDADWHEAAIRDYDHVLSVLREAALPEPSLDVERAVELLKSLELVTTRMVEERPDVGARKTFRQAVHDAYPVLRSVDRFLRGTEGSP